MPARLSTIERLRAMVEAEKLRSTAVEVLLEEVQEPAREWADALGALADAVDDVADALPAWQEAEDRESKAEARDELLDILGRVIEAYDGLPLLADLLDGLDLLSEPPQPRAKGCTCNPERYDPHQDPGCPLAVAS